VARPRKSLGGAIGFGLLCATIALSRPLLAYGQDSAKKEKEALDLIKSFADDMCEKAPVESSGSELNAEGQGQLKGLASKIASIGVTGQIATNKSRGVLQRGLAAAIKDHNDCTTTIVNLLVPRFIGKTDNTDDTRPSAEPQTSSAAPEASSISGHPKVAFSQEALGLNIQGHCERSGESVICPMTITNRDADHIVNIVVGNTAFLDSGSDSFPASEAMLANARGTTTRLASHELLQGNRPLRNWSLKTYQRVLSTWRN
jgi:hypothetical protein